MVLVCRTSPSRAGEAALLALVGQPLSRPGHQGLAAPFDGKYPLRSADPAMTAEDIAAGYRQLLEVERACSPP